MRTTVAAGVLKALCWCTVIGVLAVAPGCDSAASPTESAGPDAPSVTKNPVSTRRLSYDLRSTREREEFLRGFRRSLATATPEQAVLIKETLASLERKGVRFTPGDVEAPPAGPGDGVAYDVEELPPNFVTYMSFGANPDGRGNILYGVTSIQSDNAHAKIRHDISYSVGSAQFTASDESSVFTNFHSTQISIDCGEPTTVDGLTSSRLIWSGTGKISPGQGTLGPRNCGPATQQEDVQEPAEGGGGSCDGTSCEDEYPTGYTWCMVRYTYDTWTRQVLAVEVLYCW